jgi:hypothetical protein
MYFKSSDDTTKSIHEKRESLIKNKKEIEQTINYLVHYISAILKKYDHNEISEELKEFRNLLRRNNLILKQCNTDLDNLKYQQNNHQPPHSEQIQIKSKM